MPTLQETKPVEDTTSKLNGELAVGDDLAFRLRHGSPSATGLKQPTL